MQQLTRRKRHEILKAQLESERSSFIPHWRELGEYIEPRRPRFTLTDVNKGDRRNNKIIDSTASTASRTLRAGMMSGVTSPARPWFKLSTPDPDLAEFASVKSWLHTVTTRMATVFMKSNLYNVLPITYGDLGTFATSALMIEEDFDDVVRFYPFPIGSYCIATDYRGRVNCFTREFRMTVRQLVQKFGEVGPGGKPDWSNFSEHVKNQWDQGNTETWVDVCHVICPNIDYDPKKLHSRFKKFESCYYEKGSQTTGTGGGGYLRGIDDDRYLSVKGYDYFPTLSPRWEVTGEDAYGTNCPGMTVLGDTKALQLMHKRKAAAIEKMVNPPMVGGSHLRAQKASILPGDITYDDARDQRGFRPAHEVQMRIQELLADINDHQGRIKRGYFEDLFLMMANDDRSNTTAREIDERHEEKLLALGPVMEQLNQDLLDPMIDITFEIMLRQGRIPDPPKELHGVALKVEYTSVMAQAQKLVGLSSNERFTRYVSEVVAFSPEAADKFNGDQAIDVYGDMTSVAPGIVRTDDEVDAIRQGRANAQQQAQQSAAMAEQAKTAKDLSGADLSGENALSALVRGAKRPELAQ